MFSFVGDTVLDPFMGTGTTIVVASRAGRHSIGLEINPTYFQFASDRLHKESSSLFGKMRVHASTAETRARGSTSIAGSGPQSNTFGKPAASRPPARGAGTG